jgi:hypothetical protein
MTIERIDRLELSVDERLAQLRQEMLAFPEPWTIEAVAVFMRAAYGRGYIDALIDKGELCREHGYKLPGQA